MGITTENYPALVHQVHTMLKKDDRDPFPLFMSVFDLELITHYLKDPYDFLYYVRQRINLINYFRANEEIVYLGYHLDRKLWPIDGYAASMLETDFGAIIDRNYYPYKTGLSHLLPEKDDPIHNRWKDPQFDAFAEAIKQTGHPKTTDIIFHLLDWSGDTRKDVVSQMIRLKKLSLVDGGLKTLACPAPEFGLSFVVINGVHPGELEARTVGYAVLRKYVSKSSYWLGLGCLASSPKLINAVVYLDEPWQYDPEFEETCKDQIEGMRANRNIISLNKNGKIGRNDPCPCKSGKKYKKCCGAS